MKTFRALTIFLLFLVPCRMYGQWTETFSFTNLNKAVPDGKAYGMSDAQDISSAISKINSVKIKLQIAGEFNGDLYGYVRCIHSGITNFCVLINRVGRTAGDPEGYADAGINIVFDDNASQGDIHQYRSVTNLPAGSPLIGTWQPDGRDVDPARVTDTSLRTTRLGSFANTSGSGEWTLFLADLESGGTNMLVGWEVQLSGTTSPSIAWLNPDDIIYGTELGATQLNASSPVAGTFVYTPPIGTRLNAGSNQVLSVIFTPKDASNYEIASARVTVNVLRKPLAIRAGDASRTFGTANPAFHVIYDGFVFGDTVDIISGAPELVTMASTNSPVGDYPIFVQTGSLVTANYAITPVNGTLTITKAAVVGILSSSQNPTLPNSAVTFSYRLSPASGTGTGTPAGQVQFKINGIKAGEPVLLDSSVATYRTSSLLHGFNSIVAQYSGDENFNGVTNILTPEQLVNTPPEAGQVTIWRNPGDGVKMSVSFLLKHVADADGDPITLISVSDGSVNIGTVAINTNWIFYSPASQSTNIDSFTYIVSDGFGEPVIGIVTVNVMEDNNLSPNLSITILESGFHKIRGSGIPGRIYRIECCDDLNIPTWLQLGNVTADASGVFVFLNENSTSKRFYRSAFP